MPYMTVIDVAIWFAVFCFGFMFGAVWSYNRAYRALLQTWKMRETAKKDGQAVRVK